MPNTLIREGYLDSDRVSALSDFDDRVFFRILLAADDAGRTDGRVDKLRSALFPTRENVRGIDVSEAVGRLTAAGLLIRWQWDRKPVIQITRWQRRSGAQFSKFPDSNGQFRIEWIEVETRDGIHAFSSSSLDMGCKRVSEPIDNPLDGVFGKPTYTNTETDTKSKSKTKPPSISSPDGSQPEKPPKDLTPQAVVVEEYRKLWREKYQPDGPKLPIVAKKDFVQAARLVKECSGKDAVIEALSVFFVSADDFVADKRHPFGLFITGINTYIGGTSAVSAEDRIAKKIGMVPDHLLDEEEERRLWQDAPKEGVPNGEF